MKRIDIIAGARPNFVKIAPIIETIRQSKPYQDRKLDYRLVHTGQHYDRAMSEQFFEDLQIPAPDVNLGVGSGSHAEQTGNIMMRYEKVLRDEPSDVCLVVGDVNSTLACSIVAQKLGIKVGHVEAGIRSGDWLMPEEINRLVTDAVTNWFFTTSQRASQNLRRSGVPDEYNYFVGNTMIDTLLKTTSRLRRPELWTELGLQTRGYIVLTLHRPSNVDSSVGLAQLLATFQKGAGGIPIVFPIHPRTEGNIVRMGINLSGFHCVKPLGYLEFNYLVRDALAVITDSGGISEETTMFGVPCLTIRDSTERPETVEIGTNELVGMDPDVIVSSIKRAASGSWKRGGIPELWDGHAAERIVKVLCQKLGL